MAAATADMLNCLFEACPDVWRANCFINNRTVKNIATYNHIKGSISQLMDNSVGLVLIKKTANPPYKRVNKVRFLSAFFIDLNC